MTNCPYPPRKPGDPGYTSADIHCDVYGTDQHPMDPGHPRWRAPGAEYPDPSTVYPTQDNYDPRMFYRQQPHGCAHGCALSFEGVCKRSANPGFDEQTQARARAAEQAAVRADQDAAARQRANELAVGAGIGAGLSAGLAAALANPGPQYPMQQIRVVMGGGRIPGMSKRQRRALRRTLR